MLGSLLEMWRAEWLPSPYFLGLPSIALLLDGRPSHNPKIYWPRLTEGPYAFPFASPLFFRQGLQVVHLAFSDYRSKELHPTLLETGTTQNCLVEKSFRYQQDGGPGGHRDASVIKYSKKGSTGMNLKSTRPCWINLLKIETDGPPVTGRMAVWVDPFGSYSSLPFFPPPSPQHTFSVFFVFYYWQCLLCKNHIGYRD